MIQFRKRFHGWRQFGPHVGLSIFAWRNGSPFLFVSQDKRRLERLSMGNVVVFDVSKRWGADPTLPSASLLSFLRRVIDPVRADEQPSLFLDGLRPVRWVGAVSVYVRLGNYVVSPSVPAWLLASHLRIEQSRDPFLPGDPLGHGGVRPPS